MKIIISRDGREEFHRKWEDYAEVSLNGADYDRGQLEEIEETVSNNSRAIGRLLGILYEQKMLTPATIAKILSEHTPPSITVTD